MSALDTFLSVAIGQTGKPYVWGDAGPSAFDCSGLVSFAAAAAGITLPHNAAEQQNVTTPVSNPVPGDLVFFGQPAYHVGIYMGGGQMLSAPHAGATVHVGAVGTPTGYGRIKGLGGLGSTLGGLFDKTGLTTTPTSTGDGGIVDSVRAIVLELLVLALGLTLVGYGLARLVKNHRTPKET